MSGGKKRSKGGDSNWGIKGGGAGVRECDILIREGGVRKLGLAETVQ